MRRSQAATPDTWLRIIGNAYALFDDAVAKGFGPPPFSLGGGTVLMLRFRHRLSKDIDFFGYDAQWLSLLSPRLNATAADMAESYTEQANAIKIVTAFGDIDFIIAGDVAVPVSRGTENISGRPIAVDPTSEIIAKKLFYRAATFKPRDVYDLSAAIDLDPEAAARAVEATSSKQQILLRRLDHLERAGSAELLSEIIPYDGDLKYGDDMIGKVRSFVTQHDDGSRRS